MYPTVDLLDFICSLLLLPLWVAAVVVLGRMHTRKTVRRMRVLAKAGHVLIVIAGVLVAGRIAACIGLATLDWMFVSDRKLGTLTFMVLATIPVLALTLPRLRPLRRLTYDDRAQAPTDAQRAAAYEPALVLPVQVAALAALPGMLERYLPPYQAAVATFLVTAVLLGLLSAVLVVRARRRYARLAGANPSLPSRGRVRLVRLGVTAVVLLVLAALSMVGIQNSALPETFSMMQGNHDFGGGAEFDTAAHSGHAGGGPGSAGGAGETVSVDQMKGPRDGVPDRTFTLTAEPKQVRLGSGATVDAWTFNGQVPGPELRVREGDLVQVTLVNKLADMPVTIHWHGVDVPNGEDGVAGVTQDAVAPGQSYTYRWRATETGTRWYHSHQQASEQVIRGLFGPLVIEPREPKRAVDTDIPVLLHDWDTADRGRVSTLGESDTLQHRPLAPGTKVRLRLINSGQTTKWVTVTGVPYRVTAYDGTDLNEPGEVSGARLELGGANRYDVEFTMPATPVRVAEASYPDAGIAFSADGRGEVAADTSGPVLDMLGYGAPAATPFDAGSSFDRTFSLVFDVWLGFYNGAFALRQTINGQVFPDAPMHMVREGELIRMTFLNRGDEDHPMHIHGHHFLVLSKNGNRPSGSPIWLDTVNVRPGDRYEIGFRADNPGVWMDHCHNFLHTRLGMVLHLAYQNVSSPYQVGGTAHNHPD
ncbi:multicopper oxidase family protein [Actinophytocola sp.]|uniref:multicopper oxidase family protein n=1 Tax=Actinophytocola sp. TaxID=1872138 RepID=UPI002D806DAF|nr:multicopper oxidase family protein [Actinophytocola sp.]HET9141286.1 multicopper oxidase family protein [Actinophytocola sp.]